MFDQNKHTQKTLLSTALDDSEMFANLKLGFVLLKRRQLMSDPSILFFNFSMLPFEKEREKEKISLMTL